MSKREDAAVAMVLAGATRRAACEEHAVYPANLRRALRRMRAAAESRKLPIQPAPVGGFLPTLAR